MISRLLPIVLVAGLLASCDLLPGLRDRDLEISYVGDDGGTVERASVAIDTRVIASAKRVATRKVPDQSATEIDVEETHFVRGTPDIVYTGRLVFQCKAGEAWCRRVGEAPASGTRPRDVFRAWPTRIDAGTPPASSRP